MSTKVKGAPLHMEVRIAVSKKWRNPTALSLVHHVLLDMGLGTPSIAEDERSVATTIPYHNYQKRIEKLYHLTCRLGTALSILHSLSAHERDFLKSTCLVVSDDKRQRATIQFNYQHNDQCSIWRNFRLYYQPRDSIHSTDAQGGERDIAALFQALNAFLPSP